jgi:sugar/nucleoside kinase (ribokinase family)
MAQSKSAVVAGHICVDVIPNLDGFPAGKFAEKFTPGRLVDVGPATFSTGGAVSNTGLSMHRLGIPTRLAGKVGTDPFAGIVRSIVDSYSTELSTGLVTSSGSPTSYTLVICPPGVDRIFLHCPGANDTFCADDLDYSMIAQADLFHFGYPPLMRRMFEKDGAELVEIFRRAKATGVTTSLDMALPDPTSPAGQAAWEKIVPAVAPYLDIFLPSIEEILYMIRRPLYQQLRANGDILDQLTPDLLQSLGDELLGLGVKIVLLKLGDRGIYLHTAGAQALAQMGRSAPADPTAWADQHLWAPCFQVQVVGTTGSGDATIAGFLAALLRGLPAREAATFAVAVGACNVEAPDALTGVRSWEETCARIAAGWARRPLQVSAPGWAFDEEYHLWAGTV